MTEQQKSPDGARQPMHDLLAAQYQAHAHVEAAIKYLIAAVAQRDAADQAVKEAS